MIDKQDAVNYEQLSTALFLFLELALAATRCSLPFSSLWHVWHISRSAWLGFQKISSCSKIRSSSRISTIISSRSFQFIPVGHFSYAINNGSLLTSLSYTLSGQICMATAMIAWTAWSNLSGPLRFLGMNALPNLSK